MSSVIRQPVVGLGSAASVQYDAFSAAWFNSGGFVGPFGIAGNWGYQSDPNSGLQLLGHRYYEPSTGRFLTRDPIKDGRNWYAYVENNPLTAVDPDGQMALIVPLVIIGGALIISYLLIDHLRRNPLPPIPIRPIEIPSFPWSKSWPFDEPVHIGPLPFEGDQARDEEELAEDCEFVCKDVCQDDLEDIWPGGFLDCYDNCHSECMATGGGSVGGFPWEN